MRPLRIWTPVWGAKHLNILVKGLSKSLLWPRNFESIKKAKWSLFIHYSEADAVMEAVTKVLPPEQIELLESRESKEVLTAQRGVLMCQALCKEIQKCLDDNHQFLISTPDFLWADGSIENMRNIAQLKNVAVSIPHPRVTPSIIDHLDTPLSNFSLCTLAKAHPHAAWTMSQHGANPNGTFKGGIIWRSREPGITTLQHRMPSPYLVNFTPDDLAFFSTDDGVRLAAFGAWDHQWSDQLIDQQRWRMIMGSDIAFMCEVTDLNQNVPPMDPIDHNEPDKFWHPELNFAMNRQYVATFRSEK